MASNEKKSSTKLCITCGGNGPFGRDKSRKDGLDPRCKPCRAKSGMKYRKENPKKVKESSRRSRKRRLPQMREYARRYRKDNPDRSRGYNRKYYREHREQELARNRQWRIDHPDYRPPNDPLKIKARSAVTNAIAAGKLVIGQCTVCELKPSTSGKQIIEAHHHNGYAREHWLDIEWLCQPHHYLADRK